MIFTPGHINKFNNISKDYLDLYKEKMTAAKKSPPDENKKVKQVKKW